MIARQHLAKTTSLTFSPSTGRFAILEILEAGTTALLAFIKRRWGESSDGHYKGHEADEETVELHDVGGY